jgi:hypothetical protein
MAAKNCNDPSPAFGVAATYPLSNLSAWSDGYPGPNGAFDGRVMFEAHNGGVIQYNGSSSDWAATDFPLLATGMSGGPVFRAANFSAAGYNSGYLAFGHNQSTNSALNRTNFKLYTSTDVQTMIFWRDVSAPF